METTSKLTDQPFLILYPERENDLVPHIHIPARNIRVCILVRGFVPSISKSWAAFLEYHGKIVALRRVSLITYTSWGTQTCIYDELSQRFINN